jgi:hypothetical protein
MRKTPWVLLLLCAARMAPAQSYEGYIGGGSWPLWIWMDLDPQGGDGSLTGSYFYKRRGGEIPLVGKIVGRTLRLGELDKQKKETAFFTLTISGDTLSGTWKKTGGQDSLAARLFKTDPAYRKTAKFPKPDKLVLAQGATLANELDGGTDEEYPDHLFRSKPEFSFARKNILCVSFNYSRWAVDVVEGTVYHTFNLKTRKEIRIRDEIDPGKFPAFKAYFEDLMLPRLPSCREGRSDSEWEAVLGYRVSGYEGEVGLQKALDTVFAVPQLPENADYLLNGDSLEVDIQHYFDLPRGSQVMDCTFDMKMPLSEFGKYLRRSSPLLPITVP